MSTPSGWREDAASAVVVGGASPAGKVRARARGSSTRTPTESYGTWTRTIGSLQRQRGHRVGQPGG